MSLDNQANKDALLEKYNIKDSDPHKFWDKKAMSYTPVWWHSCKLLKRWALHLLTLSVRRT